MFVLGLITCVVLRAFSAQAKVVDSFEECKEFFYKGKEPSGMDQNAKKICQKLETSNHFYYATLYSVYHKIPLYSAYTLDPACKTDKDRKDIWSLEPQISQRESQIDYMVRENTYNQNVYKGNQAISSDYSNTGYDRGHLNPSSFQCSDGRTATFTLTNAAPMKERFNRVHWKRLEIMLRTYLIQQFFKDGGLATAFIVTGTVPDHDVRIPHTKRVTVPSHVWTAVCYKHLIDDTKSFSFGYIGRNQQEKPDIRLMSVSQLNNELKSHFGTNQPISIFADDCFGIDNNLVEVQLVFQKLINLPVTQADQISSEIQNTFSTPPEKRFRVNENTGNIAFDSMSTYYDVTENLKIFTGSDCLITYVKSPGITSVHDELRKRQVSAWSDDVECQLVPENQKNQKTAADGSTCSSVSESDYSCRCDTGKETKLCCSTPCLYMEKISGYRCYSDQKLIECSPPYSLITYKGKRCLDDHPCATYGYDYYWCWTSYNFLDFDWDYCSPPLRYSKTIKGQYCRSNHACAKYGYKYTWCYTDDKDNWNYC
ncbi:uncharacterized protein LOC127157336 [Labeo rohita]|uniref:uncharacterized protein LOC127157336 n=1 Tax=Labeo rohita TaxID=84645 RepID=UPI0021E33FF3|nr:uncharacterized protein LOC127157336 [Labeo rohita]